VVPKSRPSQDAVIATLAILKVNSDHGADYVDNFVPFVAECLRKSASDVVSLTDLSEALRANFGLDIPDGPLRTILSRAVRDGYARYEQRVVVRNPKALENFSLQDARANAARQVSALVERLVRFSSTLLESAWLEKEAEGALLNYLADRGASLLAASAADIPIALPAGALPDEAYVLASFVSELHRADPEGYEYLSTAVKGSVLASVLYFDDLGSIQRSFKGLDAYIDTVILLQGLGYLGPELATSTRQMLDLSRELGARLWCFRETVGEIEGILGFAERYVRSGRPRHIPIWGATEFLVSQGRSATDIELLAAHISEDLRSIGVEIRERPPHEPSLTVDEAEFARRLSARVRYPAEEPLKHDLDAITAIHRLRAGEVFTKIETCRAIFVTTNTPLARAATAYFRELYGTKLFAPLSMPAHQFGTLAWLKRPLATPDLPMTLVLADAVAALNPPQHLWREYVSEINKLEESGAVSADDYQLLRYSPAAKEALMGVTIGGSRAFLEGSVPEILDRVRRAERREAEEAASLERQRRQEVEESSARQLASQAEAHELALVQVRADAATERENVAAASAGRFARYDSAGKTIARALRALFLIVYLALSAIQLYQVSPFKPIGELDAGFLSAPPIGIGLLAILLIGAFLAFTGEGVGSLTRRAEDWVARACSDAIYRLVEGRPRTRS
jgi:hypothetical protein